MWPFSDGRSSCSWFSVKTDQVGPICAPENKPCVQLCLACLGPQSSGGASLG